MADQLLKLSSRSDNDQNMDIFASMMHSDSSPIFSDHFSAAAGTAPPPPFYNPNTSSPPTCMDMREMIFRIAVMQPVHVDPESVKPPKRRNVRISKDPQSVAARQRRERIGEKIRILQRLVPGGTRMDTASMLDEAVHYVKFLKKQVQELGNNKGLGLPETGGGGYNMAHHSCQPPVSSNYMLAGAMQQHVLRSYS